MRERPPPHPPPQGGRGFSQPCALIPSPLEALIPSPSRSSFPSPLEGEGWEGGKQGTKEANDDDLHRRIRGGRTDRQTRPFQKACGTVSGCLQGPRRLESRRLLGRRRSRWNADILSDGGTQERR